MMINFKLTNNFEARQIRNISFFYIFTRRLELTSMLRDLSLTGGIGTKTASSTPRRHAKTLLETEFRPLRRVLGYRRIELRKVAAT